MDMPPVINQHQVCIERAASYYGAHPDLVRAVLRTEGGKAGLVHRNRNGTVDMGPMQINSIHLKELARFGITQAMLINNECLNIFIGTYYLQKGILAAGAFWRGVGNYHSTAPAENASYQYRVWHNLEKLRTERIE